MKRSYQIEKQRAVNEFRQLAASENPNVQMTLPMAEIVSLLQQGVGHLLREAGLALMGLVMEEEVRHIAGERHQQHEERRAHRWGKEDGYCVIDGQKVPIQRTRLRTKDKREQRLGSYELFQRSGPLQQGVWDKMMRGRSTRNYGAVVKDFSTAYGIEKSAVSETRKHRSWTCPNQGRGRRRMQIASNLDTKDAPLLDERQVAEILNISIATLRRWRLLQTGPRFLKLGSAVRYKPSSVSEFVATRPSGGSKGGPPQNGSDRKRNETAALTSGRKSRA